MQITLSIPRRHLILDMPPLYAKVGFSREKAGFDKKPNIAFFYDAQAVRIARAFYQGMAKQRRLPRLGIYRNSVQLVGNVNPIPSECKTTLNRLLLPRLIKKCAEFSLNSAANFTPEELPTFRQLFREQEFFTVQIYGPRGEESRALESFELSSFEKKEIVVAI